MEMIDEQRFAARRAALDAAARIFVTNSAVLTKPTVLAESFEAWIMRPAPAEPVDTSKVDDGPRYYMCACGARQPCAAHPAPVGRPKS